MKSASRYLVIILAGTLAACAEPRPSGADSAQHDEHHLAQPASSGASGTMDDVVKDMPCARKMRGAANDPPRGKPAEEDMQSMSPSERQQQLAMMAPHCR
jgi:hypothetical protein